MERFVDKVARENGPQIKDFIVCGITYHCLSEASKATIKEDYPDSNYTVYTCPKCGRDTYVPYNKSISIWEDNIDLYKEQAEEILEKEQLEEVATEVFKSEGYEDFNYDKDEPLEINISRAIRENKDDMSKLNDLKEYIESIYSNYTVDESAILEKALELKDSALEDFIQSCQNS